MRNLPGFAERNEIGIRKLQEARETAARSTPVAHIVKHRPWKISGEWF